MSRRLSLRFDVDTHRCVREGMPALVDLGGRLEVPFTFFVNMGPAISRWASLGRIGASAPATAAKLSARSKLGTAGWLTAAVLNPPVGAGSPEVLRRAHRAGHEVGLHGGRNHATWQRGAAQWSRERIEEEIDSVLPALTDALGTDDIPGFASPGWTTHPMLADVLVERGFRYLADLHGPPEPRTSSSGPDEPPPGPGSALPLVRTQLTGEPGGVAYLEHLRARGMDDGEVLTRFEADLLAAGDDVALYDHPYHAGIRELPTVERLVERARALGYAIVPMAGLAGVGGAA